MTCLTAGHGRILIRGGINVTKGMQKYFKKKIFWFIVTFIAAIILNFILPRMMPGDPVNAIVGKNISPGATAEQVQEQIAYYKKNARTIKAPKTQK